MTDFEFNDYKRLTRGYLRDYRMWQSAVEVWASEKADIDSELASIPIATSKFGGEAGGGSGELTPTERERLQGLPDGYTDIKFKGKPASDTRRYKAIGNGMAQPCADFVLKQIVKFQSVR